MKVFPITGAVRLMLLAFILINTVACTKCFTHEEAKYGCETKVVLQTVSNTAGQLIYSPTQAEWVLFIDLPGNVSFGCQFCNKTVLNSITAGHSLNDVINVTVSGDIKRRYEDQIPISVTTGYKEVYLITTTTIN